MMWVAYAAACWLVALDCFERASGRVKPTVFASSPWIWALTGVLWLAAVAGALLGVP